MERKSFSKGNATGNKRQDRRTSEQGYRKDSRGEKRQDAYKPKDDRREGSRKEDSEGRRSDRDNRFGKQENRAGKSEHFGRQEDRAGKSERFGRQDNRTNKNGSFKKQDDRKPQTSRVNNKEYSEEAKKPKMKLGKNDCPYAEKCGGCSYQGVPYEGQLAQKQMTVRKLCKDVCQVETIQGMENPKYYRNKVHAVFDRKKDGTFISGVYEEKTHRVIDVKSCMIEDQVADSIINDITGMLKSFKIKVYNENSGFGLLRHVLVRRGFSSGEVMVVLVITDVIFPSKNNFVKAIRKLHPEISTIVLNINDKDTTMVLGSRDIVIYGKGYITDTLCGMQFKISPQSFYQINPVQTEKLYRKAIELAKLTGRERVVDAYCGIGTIGLIASKQTKETIGVELNKEAVKDAIENAKLNNNKKAKFFADDAGEFMLEMAEKEKKVDVVFMDPPRSGSDEKFMDAVATLAPKRVVYISCNPETLVRDLKYMNKKGYKADKVYPFDMFPYTSHIECVTVLQRKDS